MVPTVSAVGSINLYAAIRATNAGLPPGTRIKVWLGEPPIDWDRVKTKEDWQPLDDQRDSYPAALVEREILSKSKKALLIYGAGHLGVYPGYDNIRARLDRDHAGATYIVSPYVGYGQKDCAARFERHITNWPVPSLLSVVRRSVLENDLFRAGCNAFPRPAGLTDASYETSGRNNLGLTSNALLYLGPRESLTLSPGVPDTYLDLNYRSELDRRMLLRTGNGMKAPDPAGNPATVALGDAKTAAPVGIMLIDKIGCADNRPSCPASGHTAQDFSFASEAGMPEPNKARIGVGLAPSDADNPLSKVGEGLWIVQLPRAGEATPGRLILNPTAEEIAGFTRVQVSAETGELAGCVIRANDGEKVCGQVLPDTGGNGMLVEARQRPTSFPWSNGTQAVSGVVDGHGTKFGMPFVVKHVPGDPENFHWQQAGQMAPRISGSYPF